MYTCINNLFRQGNYHRILMLFLSASFLILTGCTEKEKNKERQKVLMQKHDEEMAKMDKLFTMKEKLEAVKKSLNDSLLQKEVSLSINRLKEADEAMMNWMREYKEPDENLNEEEKRNYYELQTKKINEVKMKMDISIDSANYVLNKISN